MGAETPREKAARPGTGQGFLSPELAPDPAAGARKGPRSEKTGESEKAGRSGKAGESEKTGIARLAAESPLRDERNDVEYFDLPCRSVLNPCDGRDLGFDFSINPYRGCELGCTYCYARYTHHYLELEDPLDFERKIYAKRDVGSLLERDLARRARALSPTEDDRGWIAIGTATDPYQPIERRRRATREVLETLARRDGLRVSITTKSDLVVRDVDLLRELSARGQLQVNVSITTTDRDLARRLEPRAPTPELRLSAVERLAGAGIHAGVFAIPILPELTDSRRSLRALVAAAKDAGARFLTAGVLFLRPAAKARFMPWLAREFPELVPVYRRLYRSTYPPAAVADRIRRVVRALRFQYGLASKGDRPGRGSPCSGPRPLARASGVAPPPAPGEQLGLFRLDSG